MKVYGNSRGDRFSLHVLLLAIVSGAAGVGTATIGPMALFATIGVYVALTAVMILDLRRFDLMVEAKAPSASAASAPRPLPPFAMKPQSDAAPAKAEALSRVAWSSKKGEKGIDPALVAGKGGSEKRPHA